MRVCLPAAWLLLGSSLVLATDPADVESLIEADRQFAADVAEHGVREGFLRHLIEESVVFRPLPVSARTWFEGQDEPPFTLKWQPRWIEVAASGDFGYTVGTWTSLAPIPAQTEGDGELELTEDNDEASYAVLGRGYYTTVWIKGSEGRWHPLADHGIGGLSSLPMEELALRGPAEEPSPISGSFLLNTRYQALMRNALRLPAAQAADAVERAWLANDLMILRSGQEPVEGHEAVRAVAAGELGLAEPALMVMAASGDLGMSLGGDPDTGAYLRVWRHHEVHGWVLAIDVATALGQAPDALIEELASEGD